MKEEKDPVSNMSEDGSSNQQEKEPVSREAEWDLVSKRREDGSSN
jgi:hypothetical protein